MPTGGTVKVKEKKNKSVVELTGDTKSAAVGLSGPNTQVSTEGNLKGVLIRQSTSSNGKNKPNELSVKAPAVKNTGIVNNSKQGLEAKINSPKLNKVTFSSSKNVDDKFKFDGVKTNASSRTDKKGQIKNSTLSMGKGDDTVTFGKGVKFKGRTKISLGQKGGTDMVIIGSEIKGGGKVKVTQFSKKDTIKVAGETFTYQDIKDGAQIPGIDVKLA